MMDTDTSKNITAALVDNQDPYSLKDQFLKYLKKSGYFKVPNNIFGSKLSAYAKLVMICLCRRADKSGVSFPSKNKIAKDCGISKRTVDNAIEELSKYGIVHIQRRFGKSNIYNLDTEITDHLLGRTNMSWDAADAPPHVNNAPLPVQEMHLKENTEGKHISENPVESKNDSTQVHTDISKLLKEIKQDDRSNNQNGHSKEYYRLKNKKNRTPEENKLLDNYDSNSNKKIIF